MKKKVSARKSEQASEGWLLKIKKKITRRKSEQASQGCHPSVEELANEIQEFPPSVHEELPTQLSKWVKSIKEKVRKGYQSSSTRKCTLSRVPAKIRELDEAAYGPKLFSIGPFHAGNKFSQDMNEHKVRYLLLILDPHYRKNSAKHTGLTKPSNPDSIKMETLVEAMKNLERKTRDCYSEGFLDFSSDDFVKMMVLDGCFVIQLLRFYNEVCNQVPVHDPIFTTRWMLPVLQHDLFMLENQLPLFVLDKLSELTKIDGEPSLKEQTLKFFDPLLPRDKKILEKFKFNSMSGNDDHLLAVFRSSFTSTFGRQGSQTHPCTDARYHRSSTSNLGTQQPQVRTTQCLSRPSLDSTSKTEGSQREMCVIPVQERRRLVHSVTELKEAGIKFKKMKDRDFLDIQFKPGMLEMPPLMVDDYTKPLFLNMVAYEQCCCQGKPYFTDYILFLDGLVNSSKDVEILHYDGIIDHVLGSDEEVAMLINKLSRGFVYDAEACYLSEDLTRIHCYTEKRRHRWRANLMHDYFKNPWTLLSVLAAFLLLSLTVIQTVFSFLSYLCPTNPR